MHKRKIENDHEDAESFEDQKITQRKVIATSIIRDRKAKAYHDYLCEMRDLNLDFEKSLRPVYQEVLRCIERGVPTSGICLQESVEQYTTIAKRIKKKYFPPKGVVLASGANEFGQCGLDEKIHERYVAQDVSTLANAGIVKVVAGGQSSYALNDQGEVLSWGCADNGCLGSISNVDSYAPIEVFGFMPSRLERAQNLQLHPYTSRDVRNTRISEAGAIIPINGDKYLNPGLRSTKHFDEAIVDMDAGDVHAVLLSNTGRVYTFGALKSDDGKFFHDEFPSDDFRRHPDAKERETLEIHPNWGSLFWPTHVFQLPGKATAVAATFSTSCAIVELRDEDNISRRLYTWGLGEHGELSRTISAKLKKSDEEIRSIMLSKGMDPDHPDSRLSSQDEHNMEIIRKENMVPQLVQFADGKNDRDIVKVACGGYHVLLLARGKEEKTRVFATGLNNYGQLGLGHKNDVDKFTEVCSSFSTISCQ